MWVWAPWDQHEWKEGKKDRKRTLRINLCLLQLLSFFQWSMECEVDVQPDFNSWQNYSSGLFFLLIRYWDQNNSRYHKPRYLYWSGLEKYHSCIFGYIFINGSYFSSVCSTYRALGVNCFGTCCNFEHFYCLSMSLRGVIINPPHYF